MNEQIKELHKQAFDWVQYQLQTVGSDHPVTQKEQLEMVNQKFAELIVRECMTINKVETTALDLPEYNLGMLEGYRRARENMSIHFGVEE
jgi:hypothetical protein